MRTLGNKSYDLPWILKYLLTETSCALLSIIPTQLLRIFQQGHSLKSLMILVTDMLPASFAEHRGTTVAPSVLNDKNLEAPSLYFEDIRECDFVIDFEEHSKEHLVNNGTNGQWETIVNTPFLDASMSPSLYRALYIPWISQLKNHFSDYKMYRRMA